MKTPLPQHNTQSMPTWFDSLLTGAMGLHNQTLDDMRCFAHSVNHQARQLSVVFQNEDGTPPPRQGLLKQVRSQLNRLAHWRDMIDLALKEQRDMAAAAYMIRVMRLTGDDRWNLLPQVVNLLTEQAFPEVAQVVELMYGQVPQQQRFEQQTDWLQSRRRILKDNPPPQCQMQIDRRTLEHPRVSMIVSMYNAADKLTAFLRHVMQQTLAINGQLEVILIDSQSPTDELAIFKQMQAELNFSVLYFRTPQRETIQQAWNRGIELARSDYLAFWGVDEGGHPTVLQRLADELDANPDINWAQTGGQIVEVDQQGNKLGHTYCYERNDYQYGDMHLDHTYLTFVGAVYRRQLHQHVGYYDPSFQASGDTEFKLRAQPEIRAKVLPEILGIYFNYPDQRMTEHPRAEIEDCRAYDVFHTSAGVAYCFGWQDAHQLDRQVQRALRFHNTTYPHWWSDIETATLLTNLRDSRAGHDKQSFAVSEDDLSALLARYRRLDLSGSLPLLTRTCLATLRFMRRVRQRSGGIYQPTCWIFNDLRYARHIRDWPF